MALISGIIQHLYFYHWFVSLTAMSSEFIHVEAYVRIFSPYWRLKIFHCIYLLYFVYLFIWQLLFSCSAVFYCLWPHGLQLTRPPCPSPSPRACSNSCPLSQWCHPTISSSVVPFSSCFQSSPASGYFLMSWPFASAGQSIEASASASVLSMNIQGWFPLGLTGWISLQPKGLSRVFSNTTIRKHQFFSS